MTDAAMKELFSKFQHFWRSGKKAHLSVECHAGEAWLQLRVHLPQPHQQHRQNQRKPGPSRLRRRARRAAARKHAAEEAAKKTDYTDEVAEQADTVQSVDSAAEAETANSPPIFIPHENQPAEEADDHAVQQVPEQAKQAEHARDRDVQPSSTQQRHRHRQPQQDQEKPSTGITLEDFERLVRENSRKLHF